MSNAQTWSEYTVDGYKMSEHRLNRALVLLWGTFGGTHDYKPDIKVFGLIWGALRNSWLIFWWTG